MESNNSIKCRPRDPNVSLRALSSCNERRLPISPIPERPFVGVPGERRGAFARAALTQLQAPE